MTGVAATVAAPELRARVVAESLLPGALPRGGYAAPVHAAQPLTPASTVANPDHLSAHQPSALSIAQSI